MKCKLVLTFENETAARDFVEETLPLQDSDRVEAVEKPDGNEIAIDLTEQ